MICRDLDLDPPRTCQPHDHLATDNGIERETTFAGIDDALDFTEMRARIRPVERRICFAAGSELENDVDPGLDASALLRSDCRALHSEQGRQLSERKKSNRYPE